MVKLTLNRALDRISKATPSDEFVIAVNRIKNQIFHALQSSGFFSVARQKTCGSIGKHTAVNLEPDIDLAVFLNDKQPYFEQELNAFRDILTASDIDVKEIKLTKYSIQFTVDGFSFDLLPATNFVEDSTCGGAELALLQAKLTMEHIKENPKNGYKYGSSVCEQTLEFLKDQTPYVHEIVRLAKFWNKTLHFGDIYISGRSTMIELIAIQAAKEHEATGGRSYLAGFKKFLKLVKNFQNLNVKFCGFYQEHEILPNVNSMRPLVLDSVNHYNNFARFSTKDRAEIIANFSKFASVTLTRLINRKKIYKVFEIQPKVLLSNFQNNVNWIVTVTKCPTPLIIPKMKVRISEQDFKEKGSGVDYIRKSLLTTITVEAVGSEEINLTRIQQRVQFCVDMNICGRSALRNWSTRGGSGSDKTHSQFDITFSIPIPGVTNQCIEISTDLN